MTEWTVKKVCVKIGEIEKKYDLFDKKIDEVYFWKLIRYPLFSEITKKLGIYGQAHSNVRQNIFKILYRLPILLKNSHIHGVMNRNNPVDILILESPRKILVNGEYTDIYTDYYIMKFLKDNESYELIDEPYFFKHYNDPNNVRSYTGYVTLGTLFKRISDGIFFSYSKLELKLMEIIQKEIFDLFKIRINLKKMVKMQIIQFRSAYVFWDKVIKKRKPKKVYLVCSYGKEGLIAACKKNNVTSIELQHGTMSEYHLGYNFPNLEIPYFPDKLMLFGEYWFDSTKLPNDRKYEVIGFPYLNFKLNAYLNVEKDPKSIVFISQGTIGQRLSDVAYNFAKDTSYNIIYKLHPGEYTRWKTDYPILLKASKLDNFKIIDNNTVNLYEILSKSEYIVGIYSTAIFEGLALGCKPVLLNLPGLEYMDYLIKNDYVKVANDHNDVLKFIEKDDFKNFEKDYFFKLI